MEDSASRDSTDSISTTDDFVVVTPSESISDNGLHIAGNGSQQELQHNLAELLLIDQQQSANEEEKKMQREQQEQLPGNKSAEINRGKTGAGDVRVIQSLPVTEIAKTVGESTFFGAHHSSASLKDEENVRALSRSRRLSLLEGDYTLFSRITFLGSASVNSPKSEKEVASKMAILRKQGKESNPIEIVLSVAATSEGVVRLLEPDSYKEIATHPVNRILFCCRGQESSQESDCFAYTTGHRREDEIYQCHIFRCHIPEAVDKILYTFAATFRRVPKSPTAVDSPIHIPKTNSDIFTFNLGLDIREDDGKGHFSYVPKEKNCFKLRLNYQKQIILTVQQISNEPLIIERCFGLLMSAGRVLKHADLHLLEMVSMGTSQDGKTYVISGNWDPTEKLFSSLNTETAKGARSYMTVAVDLVILNVQEPVRFVMEAAARVFFPSEKFWYFTKKPIRDIFYLQLQEIPSQVENESNFRVASIRSSSQLEGQRLKSESDSNSPPNVQDEDDDDNDDEPMLSGFGIVTKECDEVVLDKWGEALAKWRVNLGARPPQLASLARKGIPEALRGEVWQLLAGVHSNDLMEHYRFLITKEVEQDQDQAISRDINRTFPANDYFKGAGGGQEALGRISRAYAVHDEEVGYVQGLSFMAAVLLLHMPEEQAFAVMVKVMYDYGVRELYRAGFEELHCKFYILDRLIEDIMPDLFNHFAHVKVEAHMYASQWFLTLFTAKFPLYTVFHIMDLFLTEGMNTIFTIALALLKCSRKDLLSLDFEGILKYFRVSLPKRYRQESNATVLIQTAINMKISAKKVKKLEKEYQEYKALSMEQEDPVTRLERDNKKLMTSNIRLDRENDELAHELVSVKISLRESLDNAEERAATLDKELFSTRQELVDEQEEKKRLLEELHQVKEMCRRELQRADEELTKNRVIAGDYKKICSQLSERLEKHQSSAKADLEYIRGKVAACPSCSQLFTEDNQVRADNRLEVPPGQADPRLQRVEKQLQEMELELAQTKLQLVESECTKQDLEHQLNSALMEINSSKNNTWLHKTFNQLKEVTGSAITTTTTKVTGTAIAATTKKE